MRITVHQDELAHALTAAARVVPTPGRSLVHASNILLAAAADALALTATDGESLTLAHTMPAAVDDAGRCALPARLLSDFVSTLPAGAPIEIEANGRTAAIACDRNSAEVTTGDPDAFAEPREILGGAVIECSSADLRTAIRRVAYAAARDQARPVLAGVHFAVEDGQLRMAAADGFRLAVHSIAAECVGPASGPTSAVIPARAVAEAGRRLGDTDERVRIAFEPGGGIARFDLGRSAIDTAVINGSFPDFDQLIPDAAGTRIEMSSDEFGRVMRTALVFARDGSGIVRLAVDPGKNGSDGLVTVTSRAEAVGDHAASIGARVDGEGTRIAFNVSYLTEFISTLGAERISLETTSPSAPGVFRAHGDNDYLQVIMPMFVQWS